MRTFDEKFSTGLSKLHSKCPVKPFGVKFFYEMASSSREFGELAEKSLSD